MANNAQTKQGHIQDEPVNAVAAQLAQRLNRGKPIQQSMEAVTVQQAKV
jgi:hypothetical protein